MLTLQDAGDGADDTARVDAALALIATWQRNGGLLSDLSSAPPNLAFNGLAAIVIQHALAADGTKRHAHERVVERLLSGITETKGVRLKPSEENRQNAELVGWPWNDGTFSWVEPTAWCLLALKKADRLPNPSLSVARIAEAERVLVDRCGVSGGWNFGGSNVLGRELSPYVPTTALGLLALQDRPALPEVARSVTWLVRNWPRERSGLALSLALIAMKVHGRPVEDLEQALRTHAAEAGTAGNLASMAAMLYALTGARHEHAALRV